VAGKPVVVDTNVGIVANGAADAGKECELACIRAVREITANGHLVLDREGRIFTEYLRYLSLSGEPGVGDAFIRWVSDHQYNEDFCTLIPLTIQANGEIAEFPEHTGLAKFDPSDKKFVAIAVKHPESPPIQVAVDRGWVRHRTALGEVGVAVVFLCPNDIGLHGD
jgi:hypothetical protein